MIECIDLAFDHILLPPVSNRKRSREIDDGDTDDQISSKKSSNSVSTSDVVCTVINTAANSRKCLHNRNKYKCKDCGGSQICQHQRQRSQCKDCKTLRTAEL